MGAAIKQYAMIHGDSCFLNNSLATIRRKYIAKILSMKMNYILTLIIIPGVASNNCDCFNKFWKETVSANGEDLYTIKDVLQTLKDAVRTLQQNDVRNKQEIDTLQQNEVRNKQVIDTLQQNEVRNKQEIDTLQNQVEELKNWMNTNSATIEKLT